MFEIGIKIKKKKRKALVEYHLKIDDSIAIFYAEISCKRA